MQIRLIVPTSVAAGKEEIGWYCWLGAVDGNEMLIV